MKILTSDQLKRADQKTIQQQQISSIDLMERVAHGLKKQLLQDYDRSNHIFVCVCGPGNNGGDGLALARLLRAAGCETEVYLFETLKYTEENKANQDRMEYANMEIKFFRPNSKIPLTHQMVIIDALFGSGLSRPLSTEWQIFMAHLYQAKVPVVSIDIPSGLFADKGSEQSAPIMQADRTYTLHAPKWSFFFQENNQFIGTFKVLDIGLDNDYIVSIAGNYHYDQLEDIYPMIPHTPPNAHKGMFGHALIAGGSYGKIGAIVLSSRAALKTGCGLVTTYTPACGYHILQSAFPEAMAITDNNKLVIEHLPKSLQHYSAIGLGMGMGTHASSQRALFELLLTLQSISKYPHLVLDADALNILAMNKDWISYLPPQTILTPHPKELERMIGRCRDDYERLEKTQSFAIANRVILIIKGAYTRTILPTGEVYFNSTGNSGMATGGSGDVLTGIITSLLCQGLPPSEATRAGVFLHGLAGDLAIQNTHPKSLTASDIVESISNAWMKILPNYRNPSKHLS